MYRHSPRKSFRAFSGLRSLFFLQFFQNPRNLQNITFFRIHPGFFLEFLQNALLQSFRNSSWAHPDSVWIFFRNSLFCIESLTEINSESPSEISSNLSMEFLNTFVTLSEFSMKPASNFTGISISVTLDFFLSEIPLEFF